MRRGPPRFVSVSIVAAATVALAACAADPYPMPPPPPHTFESHPAAIGQAIPAVVLFIQVRPGDRIELLGADPIGIADGATVEFFYSPQILELDGTHMIGTRLETLAGAVATAASSSPGPDNTFGIVARITPGRPGEFVLSGVRLRYRLNGGDEQVREGIDTIVTVCAADPVPAAEDCHTANESP